MRFNFLYLGTRSLMHRPFATFLTIASITLSATLLLSLDRISKGARESFAHTISHTDLIVGAKGGSLQLLLYSVFHLGSATNNIRFESYEEISKRPDVAWTIPISLGDSHRGFRVVGTNDSFYEHYQYRRDKKLQFVQGRKTAGLFEVVIGSDVAVKNDYKLGARITLSHGIDEVSFQNHADKPFTVVGILEKTATPIDRSLYVTLAAIEAIHLDWTDGAPPMPGQEISTDTLLQKELRPKQITAFLIGTHSRIDVLQLQRDVDGFDGEPLMGIIPGVALSELWEGLSYGEAALGFTSLFVLLVGLLGMLVTIYNSLNERRREMAVLRALGAGPQLIFMLLIFESTLLAFVSGVCGLVLCLSLLYILQPMIESSFGLFIPVQLPGVFDFGVVLGMSGLGMLLGAVPAWRAYRNSLQDGLRIVV